jgi:hypothetical protein
MFLGFCFWGMIEIELFKKEIVEFFFQLTRKRNDYDLRLLSDRFDKLMYSMTTCLSISDVQEEVESYVYHFALLYKMMLFVRDIHSGMGERDLFYMMIYIWYQYYPSTALHILKLSASSGDYGSWKDIVYFCKYVKDKT